MSSRRQVHVWGNRIQTLLLVFSLFGIAALAGFLLLGEIGLWCSIAASCFALFIEPAAATQLTLRLYSARPIDFDEAPELWSITQQIGLRAGLSTVPMLYYMPSSVAMAFSVGSDRHAAITLSDGLLRTLNLREMAGVLAHEIAHIAHGDLRVMNLADYISRLTALFALVGQSMLMLSLPWMLDGSAVVNWIGLLLLVFSPYLALAAQMGLSRIREFDADLQAAQLTSDPEGLASALAKLEQISRSWKSWLLPGWGNPDPSWLRSHPATEDRVARLVALSRSSVDNIKHQTLGRISLNSPPVRRTPRWYPGGYWH